MICALSGGADSMYLLCRLLEGAEKGGYTARAAHYNHQLRPTAQRDEDFVRAWCGEHGVPLTVGRGDVAAFAKEGGLSVEEAARTLRYAFLERTAEAEGCALTATGQSRPMLSDLRDSGAIEQDADVVMFLYRESYYEDDTENPNVAECIVAKNRHGETGTVMLEWRPEFTMFRNLAYNYDEDEM